MKQFVLRYRRLAIVSLHLTLCLVSNTAAFLLRFDGQFPREHVRAFLYSLPLLVLIRGGFFWYFKLYHGFWRYASVWDLQRIIASVVLSTGVFAAVVLGVLHLGPYPRSVFIIDAILLVCLLGGARLLRRAYREFGRLQAEKRILVYGAGDAGELIVRDIRNNTFYNCSAVGFVDDDRAKLGRMIHGVKVLGSRDDLARILSAEQPHEVLLAMPMAEPWQIRAVVRALEPYKIPIKTLPNLRDIIDGRLQVSQIRALSLEDLMARQPVDLDPEPLRRLVNGRRVLVTGAGGSIGSELARQLAALGPARLLVLDRAENGLFDLGNDLLQQFPAVTHEPLIGDIADQRRMERLFREYQPDVVFHAAAHKHVPLMELNVGEAVKNNVRGTRVLAEVARAAGTAEFVLISSDKAVNPSSVMGATKRVAELIVRSLNRPEGTRFVAVRFGNVLGSNGSVARIFEAQLARGGPLTVTHPDIRRYFMLIPEAVQLVLHAAAMQESGMIYALDMGEQIRIVDLARNLIRLSGFIPDEEIQIQFTGLRPGEKLYEELVEEGETSQPSRIASVLRVQPAPVPSDLQARVALLESAADEGRTADVVHLLSELVPSFRKAWQEPAAEVRVPDQANTGESTVGI
jgi:FlaA1/EpsC-like NDP-sugar epimerase